MNRASFIFLIFIFSCGGKQEKTVQSATIEDSSIEQLLTQEDVTELTFPLDFPIQDLSSVINRALPRVLVDDTLQLKKEGEYIALKIEPIGKALLASYSHNLDVSIPMKISAEVGKKVLGLKVNKPISLKVRADMNTQLSIDENWNIAATCRLQKIHWIEPPIVEILGMKINLQKKVEKKLQEKSADIERIVCETVQDLVPLKKQATKIWDLISRSHRVAKNPIDIWLTSKPEVFSGQFARQVKDTLRVLIYTRTNLFITPISGMEYEAIPLPMNKPPRLESENDLNIHADVYLPYDKLNELLRSQLDSMSFSYKGATILLTELSTRTARDKLHLGFVVSGDLEARIDAYAYPTLSADKSLLIDSIDYQITSENGLAHLAEWLASDMLSGFIKSHAKIPLAHVLDSLDSKIVAALDKSKIGGKVALEMDFTSIESDTLIFSESGLQWFFDVRGNAHAYLTDQLVE